MCGQEKCFDAALLDKMRARMSPPARTVVYLCPTIVTNMATSHHECFGDPPLRRLCDVIGGRR
jgi:hypothetical protein